MKTKKINDFVVKIPSSSKKGFGNKIIVGKDLFEEPYANIICVARKKSGKTTVIYNILDQCCGPNTKVIVFCNSVFSDKIWLDDIPKLLKKKNVYYEPHTSLYDEGNNYLEELKQYLQEDARVQQLQKLSNAREQSQQAPAKQKDPRGKIRGLGGNITKKIVALDGKNDALDNNEPKAQLLERAKNKKIAPEYIIIFDDINNEIKDKMIGSMMRFNRHFKAKIILSSQALVDIDKNARAQADYILVWKNQDPINIERIYLDSGHHIPLEEFAKIYYDITTEPNQRNFLYIDKVNVKLRKNFDEEILDD